MKSNNFNERRIGNDLLSVYSEMSVLKELLIRTAAEILHKTSGDIYMDSPFSEFGLRGSLVYEYIARLNGLLPVQIKALDLFSFPTILSLTEHIAKRISEDQGISEKDGLSDQKIDREQKTGLDPKYEDSVAVIGMSGRFGSVGNISEFWNVLKNGESLIQEVPESRWSIEDYYTTDKNDVHKTYSKWGSFMKDIDKFDPSFFRISGRDAEVMDPQHRFFLEECWRSLEDAGINPDNLKSLRCGIFAASGLSDYIGKESEEASSWWGNDPAVLPARISYFLDTRGPAIAVDTACSSSLTAIHLASNSLKEGESDIAIAGGVWISTRHFFYNKASKAKMLSPDGKCYTFDERANGFVPGEAAGVLVLKRLKDAEREGDRIHAIIKGTHINQDGATNGITAPSCLAQQDLIKEAFDKFNINPESIGCIEAHGTGTRLGDPVEFEALNTVFKSYTSKKNFCSLGSVKTNLGHSVMASGVSGVIKMILALKNKTLLPSLNFQTPNPLIDTHDSAFKIQKDCEPWITENQTVRRGTVSSFGFSGTNVFAILEEYNRPKKPSKDNGPALILLSAQNQDRLQQSAENLKEYLDQYSSEDDLHDIAYTLQTGRKHMNEKKYIIAYSIADLSRKLEEDNPLSGTVPDINQDKEAIAQAVKERNLDVLGKLWMNNIPIDWNALYTETIPSKISLPGYPFAKDSYWSKPDHVEAPGRLHPLVHQNISGFSKQQFLTDFNGKEFFFTDHKVGGKAILPGVACFEMVRAAAELSQNKSVCEIRKVKWVSPIHPETIKVSFRQTPDENEVEYEIGSGSQETGSSLKSKGLVILGERKITRQVHLRNLTEKFASYWDKNRCYESFKKVGLDYGKNFKGIEKLFIEGSEALGKISLSGSSKMKWNIGVLDSVFQCCIGWNLSHNDNRLMVPFQLERIIFYGGIEENIWAYIRKNDQHRNENASVFDIDIISVQGEIICSIEGLMLSGFQQESQVSLPEKRLSIAYKERELLGEMPMRALITDTIREFVADIVKFEKDRINPGQDLMNYGFDSGMLILLADKINNLYRVELTPALFYSYSTINELIDFLEENHKDELYGIHRSAISGNSDFSESSSPKNNPVIRTEKEGALYDKPSLKGEVTEMIREFVAEVVKFEKDKIKVNQDLMNYGFDSAMLILLTEKINSFYKVTLTPALFYSYSSIEELVDFLEENHSVELHDKHYSSKEEVLDGNHAAFQSEKNNNYSEDDVVIVGISGRFPGCENLNDFWQKIHDEENMITEIPSDRWDWKEIYGDPALEANKTKAKWGGFISDIDKFDAMFFGISPAEAALIDPQQRIFIEAVYGALEDGGISPSEVKGTDTGVFVGTFNHDYSLLLHDYEDAALQGQVASGTIHSILANRISYLLDIHGPSEPIDTACSSSLIAIRRATESIRSGRCRMAIAGGVNALLSANTTLSASNAGMLSESGACKSFDAGADGYVRSEGVGVVILKTLGQAKKEGDHIYAVIRGTAENHGGRANTLTSPNPLAQRDLLLKAYRSAGVDPENVSYIEAHGTGTPLGDPIETEGLKMAFGLLNRDLGRENSVTKTCALGSVKANIGHLESAAGMAGIIKVLLAMKHKMLPGNPMLNEPNTHLRLDESPFYLLKKTQPWTTKNNTPRIAGISSFGYGGVNAHIILEEYQQNTDDRQPEPKKAIIPISAKDKDRLHKRVEDLFLHIRRNPEERFQNIAFTLQAGREPMEERIAFIAEDIHSLQMKLQDYLEGKGDYFFKNSEEEIYDDTIILSAIEERNLKLIAQAWVNKCQIDWKKLYPSGFPVKVSLPSYPFYKKRHWLQGPKKSMRVRYTRFRIRCWILTTQQVRKSLILLGLQGVKTILKIML